MSFVWPKDCSFTFSVVEIRNKIKIPVLKVNTSPCLKVDASFPRKPTSISSSRYTRTNRTRRESIVRLSFDQRDQYASTCVHSCAAHCFYLPTRSTQVEQSRQYTVALATPRRFYFLSLHNATNRTTLIKTRNRL